jgi:hypothetical protein
MMERTVRTAVMAAVLTCLVATPGSGQRLLEEWQVRPTAGAEALARGATAVFWNPAQVRVANRGEVSVMDLRAPGVTGVDGLAAAVAYELDGRTVLGLGYEYMGVSGVERTTTSPDGGSEIDLGENRIAAAASHMLNDRLRVGALVRYTRLPEIATAKSVIAMGVGFSAQPATRIPVELAGMAATEGDAVYWSGGVGVALPLRWPAWQATAEYGVAGGELAPGATHRLAVRAQWREHVELSVGAASEPDGRSRSLEPVGGVEVRLHRYRLGMVREQLPNDFGGAYSFRFSIGF